MTYVISSDNRERMSLLHKKVSNIYTTQAFKYAFIIVMLLSKTIDCFMQFIDIISDDDHDHRCSVGLFS